MGKNYTLFFVLALLSFNSFSRGKVTGKILNTKNEPLAGVSVKATGTTGRGTSSDMEGRFTINLPIDKKNELEFPLSVMKRKSLVRLKYPQAK